MKTRLIIEIETKDNYEVFPDYERLDESEYGKGEVEKFREEFKKGIIKQVKDTFERFIEFNFEESFIEDMEEWCIEGWDCLEDYGIKVNIGEEKP